MAIVVTPDHDGTQDTATSAGGILTDTRSFMVTGLFAAFPDTAKRRIGALFQSGIPVDGAAHPAGAGITAINRTAKMLDQDNAIVVVSYGLPETGEFDPQIVGTAFAITVGSTSSGVESNIDGAGATIITEHTPGTERVQSISSMESMSTFTIQKLQDDSPGTVSRAYARSVNDEDTMFGQSGQKGCVYCESITGSWVPAASQWIASYSFVYRAPYTADIGPTPGVPSSFQGWEVRVIEHDPDTGQPYTKDKWATGTVAKVKPFPFRNFDALGLTWPP